jgi:transposase InsO family protein
LKISKLPKSTYYFEEHKEDFDIRNEDIIESITAIFNKNHGRYGVRRVHKELMNQGYRVNHKKVQRLMHKFSLKGKRPKEKYHSYVGNVGKTADNIISRDFSASRPDEKWTTDVSQFNLPFGKCYLSPILDMYTNEIISYDLSLHPNYEQITNMLDKAFQKHPDVTGLKRLEVGKERAFFKQVFSTGKSVINRRIVNQDVSIRALGIELLH